MDLLNISSNPKEMKTVVMDDDDFTIEEVVAVARYHAKVEFSPAFIERVNKSRAIIDRFVEEDRPVYGVTTGFGDNVTKRVTPEDAALLQLNIARSHAVSMGEPLKEEQVRAIQMPKLTAQGCFRSINSIIERIRDLLNHNVTPYVPGEGVVGALSTEGQTTLPLIGEGKAYYDGKLMSGSEALKAAELTPYILKSKEGLSLLNGTPGATGLACLATYDAISDKAEVSRRFLMRQTKEISSIWTQDCIV
ncbi:MAG: aromatic amino acid lyase [Cloacibacillus evryensis]